MSKVRWAFNLSKWEPTEKQMLFATSCLQADEKARIEKFVFRRDFKASMVGRLLMRKFLHEQSGLPYEFIIIDRDTRNKPFWRKPDSHSQNLSFNVSHQGSYAVLAGEIGERSVGVDTMNFEYNGGRNLNEYFRLMNSNFSPSEWRNIKGSTNSTEDEQIARFYRHWALKESYVKALGIGITTDLSKVDFRVTSDLQEGDVTTDTVLFVNGEKQKNFNFEESLLDKSHCVAVALEIKQSKSEDCSRFLSISAEELLENCVPLLQEDYECCKKYFSREERP